MNKIRIITDSSCDLNKELVDKYNITIVPLNVSFGDDSYIDGEIDKEEFYRRMSSSKELPKTSCPSPERFMKSYEGEEDLIVITISSKLSGTYSTANLAKNMYLEDNQNKKIEIIDSATGSIAQGQLVVKAAKLVEEGKSLEEIVEILNKVKDELVFYGSLDTLENAIKGGRINPLAGKLINALNFKVIVKIGNHEVKPVDKARGDNNSIKKVIHKILSDMDKDKAKSLFIAHANCLDKALKTRELLLKEYNFEDINIVELGSVMGTYTSQGAVLISVI